VNNDKLRQFESTAEGIKASGKSGHVLVEPDEMIAIVAALRTAPVTPAPQAAAGEAVHELDAAMSLLRLARKIDASKVAPAVLKRRLIEAVAIADGAEGKDREYIYADVYEHLCETIAPFVLVGPRPEGYPFTASVTDTVNLLIEHYKRTATPAAAPVKESATAGKLPRWIEDRKGRDPETDALIEYIIKQQAQAVPTDLSKRLRLALANCGPGASLEFLRADILAAADEIERRAAASQAQAETVAWRYRMKGGKHWQVTASAEMAGTMAGHANIEVRQLVDVAAPSAASSDARDAGALEIALTVNRKLGDFALKGGTAMSLLNDEQLAALRRFDETCQDGEGYDVSTSMMKELAGVGVVRRTGGSWYETTDFGNYVLQRAAMSAPAAGEAGP
jgi:hypothetical protein